MADSSILFQGRSDVQLKILDLSFADAQQPEAVETLRGCSGYFFNGGDPKRLSEAFLAYGHDTPALSAIRERFATAGAVVSGSSAGAMIVSPVTLCECGAQSSLHALQDGQLFQAPGFGFVNDVLIDAHFFQRGLLGRHMFALARNRLPVGVGIDEGATVLVPADGGLWSIPGGGAVAVIDAASGATPGKLADFQLSILLPGDRFDPRRGHYEIAPGRAPVTLESRSDVPPPWTDQIFAAGGVLAVAKALVESPAAEAVGLTADNSIRVTFRKAPDTRAFGDASGYSVLNLQVSIER
jgi:cyanophycinase